MTSSHDPGSAAEATEVVVVGDGSVATALDALAGVLDWKLTVVDGVDESVAAVRHLGTEGAVIVLSHDVEVAGAALAAALDSGVSYVGAMGARHTQASRHEWLARHDVHASKVATIYGPAGLDIGANSPAEIAVSIVSEMVASRSGTQALSLKDRPGRIHPNLDTAADCPADAIPPA
ncbi:MAG: XdhC family protein [Nocardioidaceae bacterium]